MALIEALTFPRDPHTGVSSFAWDQLPNPALQRAYLAIEVRVHCRGPTWPSR